ncbi:LVIVD repeat-containing protein [Mangrovibacterium diazotrophicum]|uniref:LVIVD repeat-containing protein n=1 Tax=Mangrovibacterium diazotrophicum TaxID=1261403 RepID=A0A419W7L9_9BACT|nr:hypothetical protein [Mangrovibacterium diazotrophicum]RKD91446.1 hypothetical protein BC643_1801 [Mangrovibacterium diazotrophicum]
MKTAYTAIFVLFGLFALNSCEDKIYETYTANSPVYMSYEDLRSAVTTESARDIVHPGKIYFKDNYIFINELMDGVHVIDVSNPSSPSEVAFISIPGNVDIAIKENVLYADSYVDLVAIDVSDLNNMQEVGRVEDIFPYTIPEYDTEYRLADIDEEKGVVVGYELKEMRERIEQVDYPIYYYDVVMEYSNADAGVSQGVGGSSGSTFGVGGSMARFGLYDNYLYTVNDYTLYTFKIDDLENPAKMDEQQAGWGIETMFIYDAHLFLGTTSGMLVFSLEVPSRPSYLNQYTHIRSCDPVVVQDDLAYVTLRDGNDCGRTVNRLDVIQMSSDYSSLTSLASYPMYNPHGLGIDDELLFICDGDDGLKVYNAADPLTISSNQLAHFSDIQAVDVIPVGNYLFAIGDGGFYLYDYSDVQNIQLLSQIPVVNSED